MKNKARPQGGAAHELSEYYTLFKHELSNTIGEAMMVCLQPGSGLDLDAKTLLRVTAACERT